MDDKINQYICIDFETGGLDSMKNPPTEVAALAFRTDTFEEISRYNRYIKGIETKTNDSEKEFKTLLQNYVGYDGKSRYENAALNYTQVTIKDMESGLDSKEIVKNLIELFKLANTGRHVTKKPVLVGHNIQFDIPFLQGLFNFHNEDLSKYLFGNKDIYGNFYPSFVDTMWYSRQSWPSKTDILNHQLQTCCNQAGVDLVEAHSAMPDVVATKDLFVFHVKRLRQEGTLVKSEEKTEEVRTRKFFQF